MSIEQHTIIRSVSPLSKLCLGFASQLLLQVERYCCDACILLINQLGFFGETRLRFEVRSASESKHPAVHRPFVAIVCPTLFFVVWFGSVNPSPWQNICVLKPTADISLAAVSCRWTFLRTTLSLLFSQMANGRRR